MRRMPTGFTLIELMVVIAVATILTVVAAPGFRDLIVGQRAKTAAFALASSATQARSEAIKRNAEVQLVPVTPADWAGGWTIQVASGGAVLATQDSIGGITLTASGTVPALRYGANGRLSAPTTAPSFTVVGGSGNTRCVSFDLSGMPSSRLGGC
jgi:type IV fimbrial biogenesis protein FimT